MIVKNNQEKKGEFSPFSLSFFLEKRTFVFFILLLFNLIIANVVDFFDLSSNFSNPGEGIDLKEDILFIILFFGFVVPMFEEFIFRFWIHERMSKFIFPLIVLILYLTYLNYNWVFSIFFIFTFIVQAFVVLRFKKKILIISIINGGVFAIFHFVNFPLNELVSGAIYLPVLFFPQFVLGGTACFVRKFGFRYSVSYHILYNTLLILNGYVSISY